MIYEHCKSFERFQIVSKVKQKKTIQLSYGILKLTKELTSKHVSIFQELLANN